MLEHQAGPHSQKPTSCHSWNTKRNASLTIVAGEPFTGPVARFPRGAIMSKYRKAFLIWWVTMVVLVTMLSVVGTYIEFDTLDRSVPKFLTGLAMMLVVFCSWIPGALMQRRNGGN
jgi:hypothetical protein